MPHVGRGVRLLFSLLLAHLGASQLICDTTQAGRAKIAAQALSQLEEDYHIIEVKSCVRGSRKYSIESN